MSYEPKRWCSYGQHMVYIGDFRDDMRSTCLACHRQRARDTRTPERRMREFDRRSRYLIHYAKRRADKRGLPFDLLDHADAIERRVAAGFCEVSGLPFSTKPGQRDWDSPSIDQRVPGEGYVIGNVRIICWGVNAALGTWGLERFLEIADAVR